MSGLGSSDPCELLSLAYTHVLRFASTEVRWRAMLKAVAVSFTAVAVGSQDVCLLVLLGISANLITC